VIGNDVTWLGVTNSDPKVSSFNRKSPGSGCGRPKTWVYYTFHFLQRCIMQWGAVTDKMTSRNVGWPKVTRKWRHLTGSHREVAVKGWKLAYTIHFTSYNAVDCSRRQSRDRKWRHVNWGDRKWHGSDVI